MKRVWGFFSRAWNKISSGWAPYLEEAVEAEDLSLQMMGNSVPSFSFFFMLGLASAIATFGLIANSAPAIIGAMIIAPLMSPILSLSYGLVIIDRRLITLSAITVVAGTILVVVIGFTCTLVFGMRITGSEILSRTSQHCWTWVWLWQQEVPLLSLRRGPA